MRSAADEAVGTGEVVAVGGAAGWVEPDVLHDWILATLAACDLDGARVTVLIPDATRTCPLPVLLRAVHAALHGRVASLDAVVALGTHSPLDDAALAALVGAGVDGVAASYPGLTLRNHAWDDPAAYAELGTIPAARMADLSGGRLALEVPVRVNRSVVDTDVTLVVGPVLPHEVVGFSGGNKYLFPGVSGPEVIDVTHWLGALITSAAMIGTTGTTPVRAVIDEAASMVPSRRLALCVVTEGDRVRCASFGAPEPAWAVAAEVAAATHVRYLDRPVARVLALLPRRYDDLWTGAKGFYKTEPVVADGGEVVLYAPHVTEVAVNHPGLLEIGYHCRDYFVGQWDRFADRPWGELAHSTHLRGAGTWDPVHGEHSRVRVTLATSIPEAVCRSVGLGFLDWRLVDVDAWRADPSALVVDDAGEDLYRLRPGRDS